MLKRLFSRRGVFSYFKGFLIIVTILFYFAFLFRQSLNAYEQQNREKNYLKNELKHGRLGSRYIRTTGNKPEDNLIHYKRIRKSSSTSVRSDKASALASLSSLSPSSALSSSSYSTLNPVYEYSEELHSATEKELQLRKTHLNEICQKENITGTYPPNAWEFFLSPGHNLVWCNVFKAASSTWMYYFNILGGYEIKYLQKTKVSPIELARKRFPRPKLNELLDALSNSLSFLIVREPFERLISAFRDKIEGCKNKYYKILGKQIIKIFRNNNKSNNNNHNSTKNYNNDSLTKTSKTEMIKNTDNNKISINKYKININNKEQKQRNRQQQSSYNSGPTFKEFLLFLIQNHKYGKQFDEHWAPVYQFCTPCSINYTIIAKVETFQRDAEYIIRQAGLEPLLLGKIPKHMVRKLSNQARRSSGSLIEKYFSQIDVDILNELLKIYHLDFELFGYDYKKYFKIVKPRPATLPTFLPSSSTSTLSFLEILNLTESPLVEKN